VKLPLAISFPGAQDEITNRFCHASDSVFDQLSASAA
jgi:hypothetical protein